MFSVEEIKSRTLIWWYKQKDYIEFDLPFQRKKGVWTESDKAFLIDSILNDYDIPKIYLVSYNYPGAKPPKDGVKYAAVDGKQRLNAIFEFIEDKYPLSRNFILEQDPLIDISGMKYSEISQKYPDIAQKIDIFNLQIMSIVTDEEGRINALFIRLNKNNKPLTGAEVRAAYVGEAADQIARISKHKFFSENISFSIKRGQEKNAAAKLLITEFMGGATDTKKKNLDQLFDVSNADTRMIKSSADRVIKVLDFMSNVFLKDDNLLKNSGILPLYYWFCKQNVDHNPSSLKVYLDHFEMERVLNLKGVGVENFIFRQKDLSLYNLQARNINDQKSFEIRYAILSENYNVYDRRMSIRHQID